MRITKLGRKRPILYQGKFDVPNNVISRLAVGKTHLLLAQTSNFNGKVDEFYLAIDNLLSALIVAKEGSLTTLIHGKKIEKFFKHLRLRAKIRSIEKTDVTIFFKLWQKSRYRLYFPRSSTIEKIRLFTQHLYDFMVTEIARYFKSDERILAQRIEKRVEIFQSKIIDEEAAEIHEYKQMEAERIGEMYGAKLGMKLSNPWNFMEISLLTDRKDIAAIIDTSPEIRKALFDVLMKWDELVSKVQMLNTEHIVKKIVAARMKKKKIDMETAMKDIVSITTHPEIHKLRIILNFAIDTYEPKRMGKKLARMMQETKNLIKNPNKSIKSGWEVLKENSLS